MNDLQKCPLNRTVGTSGWKQLFQEKLSKSPFIEVTEDYVFVARCSVRTSFTRTVLDSFSRASFLFLSLECGHAVHRRFLD